MLAYSYLEVAMPEDELGASLGACGSGKGSYSKCFCPWYIVPGRSYA